MHWKNRCVVYLCVLGSALGGRAEPPSPPYSPAAAAPALPPADLDSLDKAEILNLIRELAEQLRQTREELNQLKAARPGEKPPAPPSSEAPRPAPAVPPGTPAPAAVLPPAPPVERAVVNEEQQRLERERAIRSVQRSGVLLRQGRFEAEPSFSYSHYSSNLINIDGFALLPVLVVGEIESVRVEKDVFESTLQLRYGILNHLQADVVVPYRYEEDRFVRQVEEQPRFEEKRDDYGLGDVQFGLSWQLLHEHGLVPDLLLSGRARAPTGESQFDIGASSGELPLGAGVWSVRGGLTAIKTFDPAVLIFNAGHTYNFGRDITVELADPDSNNTIRTGTTYLPGSSLDFSVAVAIALNPTFAINFGFLQRYTFRTELEGIGTIEGTSLNEAELRFGFAWALTASTAFNFTAAAGLTEDSPDFTLTLSWPVKF